MTASRLTVASRLGTTHPRALVTWIGIIGLVCLTGVASGLGYGLAAVAVTVVTLSLALALWNWRSLFLALIVFVAYTGVPSLLLYPNVGPAALIKDLLIVIPLYVGFVAAVANGREPARRLGVSLAPLAFFALWVVAESLNPLLPSPLVALVGLRVWLLYIPLALLTAYFVKTRMQLKTLLTVLVVAGGPAAILGVIQGALIAGGQPDLAYSFYGPAAVAATQGFAQFQVDSGGVIGRVPSTFSFAGQYAGFTLAYVVVTYARWRLDGGSWGAATFLFAILAAVLSGARGAFFLVPAILVLALIFEGRLSLHRIAAVAGVMATFTAILAAIGLSLPSLAHLILDTAVQEFDFLIVQGFGAATEMTTFGLGTGVDTGASRYVVGGGDPFSELGGQWYESWYVKIWLELGIVGLALVAGVISSLVRAGVRANRAAPDLGVRAALSVISAFLVVQLVYNVKGAYFDVDPVNVLFWVFVGILLAVGGGLGPRLSATESRR